MIRHFYSQGRAWFLLCGFACALLWSAPSAASLSLTISNSLPQERKAEPVTAGVPLPKGFATRADTLVLLGSKSGTEDRQEY